MRDETTAYDERTRQEERWSARYFALARLTGRAARSASDLETAIGFGEMLGHLHLSHVCRVIEEDGLEHWLWSRHQAALVAATPKDAPPAAGWLHVVTKTYDVGGHTKLLENLLTVQTSAKERVRVLVTDSTTPRFEETCCRLGVPMRTLSGSRAERAAAVIAGGRRTDFIMLHTHPFDLGPALAARQLRAEGRRVFFLNHADHAFSYGPGAADAIVEVSGFGWQLSAARRKAAAQHFLGIPIVSHASPPPLPDAAIVSMGNPWKYRPVGRRDFPAFAMKLLDRTDRALELIGPDGREPWWEQLRAKHGRRVRFHGFLPFEEARARVSAAACYIDSFPGTGGTAFTEALATGKAVFGPPCPTSGYGLADALRSRDEDTMLEDILRFLRSGTEATEQSELRRRVAREFGPEMLERRLEALKSGDYQPPPPEMIMDVDPEYFLKSEPPAVVLPDPGRILWIIRWRFAMLFLVWRLQGPKAEAPFGIRRILEWMRG